MMPRQRCPVCQNTPRLEVERGLTIENALLKRRMELLERVLRDVLIWQENNLCHAECPADCPYERARELLKKP